MPHYLILALKTKQKQNNRENNPQRVVQDVASMPHQTPIQSTFPVFMLIPEINKEPKHGRNQKRKNNNKKQKFHPSNGTCSITREEDTAGTQQSLG